MVKANPLSCDTFLGSSDIVVGTPDYNSLLLCSAFPSDWLFLLLPLATREFSGSSPGWGHVTPLGDPPGKM